MTSSTPMGESKKFVFSCQLFRAAPMAYGSSLAKCWIRAIAAGLHCSHSNLGSEHIWDLHHNSRQGRIPDPLSEARDRTWILMDTSQVCYHWAIRELPLPNSIFRNILTFFLCHSPMGLRLRITSSLINEQEMKVPKFPLWHSRLRIRLKKFSLWHNGNEQCLGSTGTQVQSPAWCSGLRIQLQ